MLRVIMLRGNFRGTLYAPTTYQLHLEIDTALLSLDCRAGDNKLTFMDLAFSLLLCCLRCLITSNEALNGV
ncbi:hypothetical protein KC19_4G140000 [Ceratodon purpureus]|uniref:Uncharacterized protein n=1 Tax=Ceratodon purpureus TaxID=3225 RepID=A0A8T0IAZ8_CERPU|nr:hypothetical protein KC19_4G140000 [Ceratodon purpureus]